jgi:hypothetical protein
MRGVPEWYLPVAILALLWNLLGCAAANMRVLCDFSPGRCADGMIRTQLVRFVLTPVDVGKT